MIVLLVSIVTLFAVVAAAYIALLYLRPGGRPVALPPLVWLSTAVLVASSATLEAARRWLEQRSWSAFRLALSVTAVLGVSFLALQLGVWRQVTPAGEAAVEGPDVVFFLILSALHGAHLAAGLGGIGVVLAWGRAPGAVEGPRLRTAAGVAALYWHAMGVLWLGILALLFAMGGAAV
jgi:cytochrome c oxidase subunit 3